MTNPIEVLITLTLPDTVVEQIRQVSPRLHVSYHPAKKAEDIPDDVLKKAEIIYVESWPATRTIEESKAAIAERQKLKDEMIAREKEAYKAFGRAAGMDVDRIEREAIAERAAQTAAPEKQDAGAVK